MSSIWKNDMPPGFRPPTWPQLGSRPNVQYFITLPSQQKNSNNQTNRPCVDQSHIRKCERKLVANETLSLLRQGCYKLSDGREIDINEKLSTAVNGATCYPPVHYFVEAVEVTFPKTLFEVFTIK